MAGCTVLYSQVDRQGALHCVAMHVAKTTHVEVAHSDARERVVRRVVPVTVLRHPLYDLQNFTKQSQNH